MGIIMATKTISVNPNFFNKSKTKKKNKKQKVENQSSDEYTNAFDFMEDIVKKRKTKKHNNQRIKSKLHIETDIRNPDISNSDIRNPGIRNPDIRDSERSFIKPDPPYGILKKGKKQLYSKYRKGLKNNTLAFTDSNRFGKELDINQEIINIKNNNFLSENIHNRKQKLENLKNKFLKNNNLDDKKEKFKIKNKKIIRKFLLGKNNKTK